jgi:hypothetical protein
MAIDGDWNLTLNSPMGKQESKLSFQSEGSSLTGTGTAQGQTSPISNGVIEGDTVKWSASITSPFPMTIEFTGKLAGDTLDGSFKAGSFGTFPFTGVRA